MSNAYFRNADALTVGSNINGPQVLFEYAGRQVQIPIPPGVDPIVAVNDYIRALQGGFGGQAGFAKDDLQQTEHPDDVQKVDPSSEDAVPADMENLDRSSIFPEDESNASGSMYNNFGSGWSPDGVNTIYGYQPMSAIPVLRVEPQQSGVEIPTLSGFWQGDLKLPQLRIRRREFAGLGLGRGK